MLLRVVLDDGHRLLMVGTYNAEAQLDCVLHGRTITLTESLLDTFLVVVLPTTGLATLQQPLQEHLFRGGIEDRTTRYTDLRIPPTTISINI